MKSFQILVLLSGLTIAPTLHAQSNDTQDLKPFCESEKAALKIRRETEIKSSLAGHEKAAEELRIRRAVVTEMTEIVTKQISSQILSQLTQYTVEFPARSHGLSEDKDAGLIAVIRASFTGDRKITGSLEYNLSQLQTNPESSLYMYYAKSSLYHGENCTGKTGCWVAGPLSYSFEKASVRLKLDLYSDYQGPLAKWHAGEEVTLVYSAKNGSLELTTEDPTLDEYIKRESLTIPDETTYLKQNLSRTCAKMFYPEEFTPKNKAGKLFQKMKDVFKK